MEKIDAFRMEGYSLLHHGAIELARVEANGIRIDVSLLAATKKRLCTQIVDLQDELHSSKVWRHKWQRRFGHKSKLSSRDQLAAVVYEELEYPIVDRTDNGNPSVDEEALQRMDDPFLKSLVRLTKYEKALGTFLKGIEREVVGERLHPVFNLHIARSYRSSSDSPNFQNLPVRDKEISQIIRSLFVPSPGCVLVENDFKAIEVSVSACYHKDSNFISYITTPGKDMHRDMAAQIYMLKSKQVSKEARYGAKNKFVFPQFYGDYYVSCARSLWDWIEKGKLLGPDGKSLYRHLERNGIKERGECIPDKDPEEGTFEQHLREVENDFWGNRFMQYGQWRRNWYRDYLDRGYFDLLTGFRVHGNFNRKQATNYPIQGSAFHCLLWSMIRINRLLRKYKMKSLVVGQIHDSLLADVRVDELRDYLEMVEQVTTVDLLKHYDWIIVPLGVEYEISPSNGSWFDKREVKFRKGKFFHPEKADVFTTDPHKFVRTLNRSKQT